MEANSFNESICYIMDPCSPSSFIDKDTSLQCLQFKKVFKATAVMVGFDHGHKHAWDGLQCQDSTEESLLAAVYPWSS